MHWKFEPFFSIEILHGKYPPLLGKPALPAPEFSVTPTDNTQRRLLRMGWVFKPRLDGGGGTLYAEKIITADGTAKLRTRPAQGEGFTFILRLNDSSILGQTKPYTTKPPSVLPPFSGRARLLYFDNLTAVAQTNGSFLLTKGAFTDVSEFASRAPIVYDFPVSHPGPGTIQAAALLPNPPPLKSFNIPAASRFARLELDENVYKITQNASNQGETLYITTEQLPENTLGIIRLFDVPNAPIDQKKQFQIVFAKA